MTVATDLRQVEILAASLRERLDRAATLIAEHDEEVGAIRARYAGQVRRLGAEVHGARKALMVAIAEAAAVFLDPRRKAKSETLHGIVCGMAKAQDSWTAPEGADLVALIDERLPELADTLTESTRRVRLDALTDEHRRVLGMVLTPGAESVVCREKSGGIAKALEALGKVVGMAA
jgi:hypothetical protein